MNKSQGFSIFKLNNESDKFIIGVDSVFSYVDSEDEANEIYKLINVENDCFGSLVIIPPKHYNHGNTDASVYVSCDNIYKYINEQRARYNLKIEAAEAYASQADDPWALFEQDNDDIESPKNKFIADYIAKKQTL
jgi:hypothetical protein